MEPVLKKCTKCLDFFPETNTYFLRSKGSKNGLRASCRICTNKASRVYAKTHPDRLVASGKKYRAKNVETITERKRAYNKTLTGRINTYKKSARDRDLQYSLSKEQFGALIVLKCHYCGTINENLNGIDRKDPKLGYVLKNCVPCCWQCNRAKVDSSYEDFTTMCKNIVQNLHLLPTADTEQALDVKTFLSYVYECRTAYTPPTITVDLLPYT